MVAVYPRQEEEFSTSRVLDAPRERVWKAWTDVQELSKWFGPKGTKIVSAKNDLHPGGIFLYAMKGEDGQVSWGKWVHREISPPSKLVWVISFSDENGGVARHPTAPDWPLEMLSTTVFDDEAGGRTRLTLRWKPLHPTEAERKAFHSGLESMNKGWNGTFEQLESYLARKNDI